MQIRSFINIQPDLKTDFLFGLIAVNLLTLGFVFGFLNPGDIDTDGGIFSAVAYKDMHGGVLYVDAWENKPPGIIYLMELFLYVIPDKIYALYILAVAGILMIVNGLYFLTKFLVDSLLLSIMLLLIFIFYGVNSLFLGDGLFTEIFGSIFILWSLYAYHLFKSSDKNKYLMISALLTGFSPWMKEPFMFIAFPLILFLLFIVKDTKLRLKISGFAILPSAIFIACLWLCGSLPGFFDTMASNFAIAGTDLNISKKDQMEALWQNILDPLFILLLIFLATAFRLIFRQEARQPLLFNLSLLAGGLAFIMISPEKFNHYYLPFLVVFFYSVAAFLHYEKQYFDSPRLIIYILLLFLMKQGDDERSRPFKSGFRPYQEDNITRRLRSEPSRTLFIDLVGASEYYIKGRKIFPAFIPVPVVIHFNESERGVQNTKRIYNELKNNLPDFLITGESSSYMYWHIPDPKLYYGNYVKTDSAIVRYNKKVILWERK